MAINACAIDKIYLIGAATPAKWDHTDAIEMTSEGNGVFTYTGEFEHGEFKFICLLNEWFPTIVAEENSTIVEPGKTYNVLYKENDSYDDPNTPTDNKFYIFAGTYTLTLSIDSTSKKGTMTVKGEADANKITIPDVIEIGGSFNDWEIEGMDEEDEDGIFSYTGSFKAGDKFRFRILQEWWYFCPATKNEDVPLLENTATSIIFFPSICEAYFNSLFYITEDGEHTIYLDTNKMIVYMDKIPAFKEIIEGACGDNLNWKYNTATKMLIISGDGDMWDNMSESNYSEEWSYIANNATKIIFPSGITSIDSNAFSDWSQISVIWCYASVMPTICETTFKEASNDVSVYVQNNLIEEYQADQYWSNFSIISINAKQVVVTSDDIIIKSSENEVTITWPIVENAQSYSVNIIVGNNVVYVLNFNEQGQLESIDTPSQAQIKSAMASATGLQYTLSGLNPGTNYKYEIVAWGDGGISLGKHIGAFSTLGTDIPTSVDTTTHKTQANVIKYYDSNSRMIIIERDGIKYSITGRKIK